MASSKETQAFKEALRKILGREPYQYELDEIIRKYDLSTGDIWVRAHGSLKEASTKNNISSDNLDRIVNSIENDLKNK